MRQRDANWESREGYTARDGVNPGDEAPPGTPDTGENVCPDCGGSGRRKGGECPACGGTGKVIEAIGGAG